MEIDLNGQAIMIKIMKTIEIKEIKYQEEVRII